MSRDENIQAVFDLKAGYTLGLADIEILKRVARMALAAMDGEPVAYIFKHPAGRLFWSLTDESNKGHDDVMPVYAAPQSPGSEPATVPGRWIPVSERMPESNGVYFGWDGKRVLEVNCFFGGFSANQFIHGEITHWMPTPAAPQEMKGE
ncbi:TPA: DUF551 domain-containing protein [Klebsiella pneumoniae]|nr:DUF551 domain-containing protein [Klebsiella pneumoniae]MCI8226847.1 DUF551 domain-containing protein [Klebsiella pneumoniae]HBQ6766141.1 DUF551 domain-containing protein [Klebsiella pneumoniae]HBR0816885.1 DUF551 domain-containing protein [Klebsiella pneumoniae]